MADTIRDLASRAFPDGGFFVEAGAHDGVTNSNTVMLPDRKWQGMLVEPAPRPFAMLQKNRTNQILENCALVGDDLVTEIEGTFADGSLMGSAHPILKKWNAATPRNFLEKIDTTVRSRLKLQPRVRLLTVSATTLDKLLMKHKVETISLLVLDVEGFELEVLRGFSFEPRPALLVIETRFADFVEIAEIMLSRGYLLAANLSNFSPNLHPGYSCDHQDYAWVDRARPEILEALAATPIFERSQSRG